MTEVTLNVLINNRGIRKLVKQITSSMCQKRSFPIGMSEDGASHMRTVKV